MQAVFVMAPLVYPLLLVWLRTAHSSPTYSHYASESLPLLGRTEDLQRCTYYLGALVIISGMANNLIYCVLGRELTRRPMKQKPIEVLLALKAAVGFVSVTCNIVANIYTLAGIVQLVILTVLALTVDPFRALAVISGAMTLYFYVKNSLVSLSNIQESLKAKITASYKARHEERAKVAGTDEKLTASSKAQLQELIDAELDRLGFGATDVIAWLCLTVMCALLVVAVVVQAQSLFFQAKDQALGQLIASLIPAVTLVISTISKKAKEEKAVTKNIGKITKKVTKAAKTCEGLGLAVTSSLAPDEQSFAAYKRSKSQKLVVAAEPEPEQEPEPEPAPAPAPSAIAASV